MMNTLAAANVARHRLAFDISDQDIAEDLVLQGVSNENAFFAIVCAKILEADYVCTPRTENRSEYVVIPKGSL